MAGPYSAEAQPYEFISGGKIFGATEPPKFWLVASSEYHEPRVLLNARPKPAE